MKLDLNAKKNAILFLFIGFLIGLIGYSYSFSIVRDGVKYSIAIPLAATISYVMWIVYGNKLIEDSKYAKTLVYVSVVGLAASWLTMFLVFVNGSTTQSIYNQITALTTQTSTDANETINQFNQMFDLIGKIADKITIISAIETIAKGVPFAICMFLISRIAYENNSSWNGEKTKTCGNVAIIFYSLTQVVSIFLVYGMLKALGECQIPQDTSDSAMVEFTNQLLEKVGSFVLVSLLLAAFAITALVFEIKLLVQVYKTQKNLTNNNDSNTSYTSYTN